MPKGVQLYDNTGDKVYPCPYFPIGAIYMSLSSANPRAFFGGTWERIAKGRVLAGIDESDTDTNVKTSFNQQAGKTLGHKKAQAHSHHIMVDQISGNPQVSFPTWQCAVAYKGQISSPAVRFGVTTKSEGDGDAQNIQPTLLCYIWTRVK